MTGYDELAADLGIDLSNPMDALARDLVAADHRFLDRLIERRQQANLSEADVAELMGCTEDEVKEFEVFTADPPLSQIRRYAIAIGAKYTHAVESPAGVPQITRTEDLPPWLALDGDPVQPVDGSESVAAKWFPYLLGIRHRYTSPSAEATKALKRAMLGPPADLLDWYAGSMSQNILADTSRLRLIYAGHNASCTVLFARTRAPAPGGTDTESPAAISTGSRHVRAEAGNAT